MEIGFSAFRGEGGNQRNISLLRHTVEPGAWLLLRFLRFPNFPIFCESAQPGTRPSPNHWRVFAIMRGAGPARVGLLHPGEWKGFRRNGKKHAKTSVNEFDMLQEFLKFGL
jgi:hypothetical protein